MGQKNELGRMWKEVISSQHVLGGTEENHEEHNSCGRMLDPDLQEFETGVPIAEMKSGFKVHPLDDMYVKLS
jgi:hypothetical protein